eukprot:g72070.t1
MCILYFSLHFIIEILVSTQPLPGMPKKSSKKKKKEKKEKLTSGEATANSEVTGAGVTDTSAAAVPNSSTQVAKTVSGEKAQAESADSNKTLSKTEHHKEKQDKYESLRAENKNARHIDNDGGEEEDEDDEDDLEAALALSLSLSVQNARSRFILNEQPAALFVALTHHLTGACAALSIGYALEPDTGVSSPLLTILNYQNHAHVAHRAVLLRGRIQPDVSLVSVRSDRAPMQPILPTFSSDGRHFKALVELFKGDNLITFRLHLHGSPGISGAVTFHLRHLPIPRAHYVRLIWATASDGDPRFATPGHMQATLMQGTVAECMYDQGFGHCTFHLETKGQVRAATIPALPPPSSVETLAPVQASENEMSPLNQDSHTAALRALPAASPSQQLATGEQETDEIMVHQWQLPKPAHFYYSLSDGDLYDAVNTWLNQEHPDPLAKNVVMLAFTRRLPAGSKKDFGAHTALGGGNLALFGSASCFAWPVSLWDVQRVFQDERAVPKEDIKDDSAGRGTIWGLVSTTVGATLHELLHTFGLPHVPDRFDVMNRGFDYFNRRYTFHEKNLLPVVAPGAVWGCPECCYQNDVQLDEAECSMCGTARPVAGPQYDFVPGTEMYLSRSIASYLRWVPWLRRPDENGLLPNEQLLVPKRSGPTLESNIQTKSVVIDGKDSAGLGWVGIYDGPDMKAHLELVPPGPVLEATPSTLTLSLQQLQLLVGAGKPIARVSAVGPNGILNQIYLN